MTEKNPSGKCPCCPYRWAITKKGLMVSHWIYGDRGKRRCIGSGLPAVEGTTP